MAGIEPGEPEDSGLDLRKLWQVVLKHRWSIIGLTLIVTLVTGLFVYRLVPVYRGTATLQIERSPVQFSPVQDPYAVYADYWLYYKTQYGLIKRRAIAERVVKRLGLVQPVIQKKKEPSSFSWKSLLPSDWFPEPPPPTEQERYESLVGQLVAGIDVKPVRDSQLVEISFESTDPQRAADIANAIAEAYIEDNLEGRIEMTQSASSYLTQRLVELRQKLQVSEAALQDFKDREHLLEVGDIDSAASQTLQLANEKLAAAQKRRFETSLLVEQIREAQADPALGLDSIPSIIAHPQVQSFNLAYQSAQREVNELSTRYGPKHPKMIAAQSDLDSARVALNQRIALVADGLQRDYRAALSAENVALAEVESARKSLREIDRKDFTLQALQREVETNRQIFDKFQTQFKETDATGGVHTANARLVERARVPGGPIKPDKKRALLVAFFLGLIASIGLAFLLDHLDNTVKSAHDVELKLDVAVLGLLPKLQTEGKNDLSPLLYFADHKQSVFAESIRTVRTGVLLSSLDHDHRVLLVTSSVPGEGKTTVSMNLSRALGEMKKVLLIDADMRRPMVARAMDRDLDTPGLSHFIAGESVLTECVTRVEDSNLYLMPAGIAPPNPLEMLSSHRFADSLKQLKEKYEHIVIDCAPTLAVSDAMVLSKLATAVIYVVRSDSTPVQAAQAGIKRLRRVGANIIGVVINQAARKTQSYYGKYSGYGDGYYSDYGYVVDEDGR